LHLPRVSDFLIGREPRNEIRPPMTGSDAKAAATGASKAAIVDRQAEPGEQGPKGPPRPSAKGRQANGWREPGRRRTPRRAAGPVAFCFHPARTPSRFEGAAAEHVPRRRLKAPGEPGATKGHPFMRRKPDAGTSRA
jgi:hypothetical protein